MSVHCTVLLFHLENLCIWILLAESHVIVKLSSIARTHIGFSCSHLLDRQLWERILNFFFVVQLQFSGYAFLLCPWLLFLSLHCNLFASRLCRHCCQWEQCCLYRWLHYPRFQCYSRDFVLFLCFVGFFSFFLNY